jgi:hypothetical protein
VEPVDVRTLLPFGRLHGTQRPRRRLRNVERMGKERGVLRATTEVDLAADMRQGSSLGTALPRPSLQRRLKGE